MLDAKEKAEVEGRNRKGGGYEGLQCLTREVTARLR